MHCIAHPPSFLAQTWDLAGHPAVWPASLKKMAQSEFPKKFEEEIADLLAAENVLKPGTASLQEYISKGHGDLDEGVRTTMRIGDLELVGAPDNAPGENLVTIDYCYYYQGKEMKIPLTSMLPTLTLIGTEETKPGDWKVLHECEKSRLWAFLKFLAKLKQGGEMGLEALQHRYEKIVADLLENLPVVIFKMLPEDELWAAWHRSNEAGHTDIQHSIERMSNRYLFFAKLRVTLHNKSKDQGNPSEVTVKQLFAAYNSAEQEQKFRTAKGMTGLKNEGALSSLMKWGTFITKYGLMQLWKGLELLQEGKTPFYTTAFGNAFCTCIDNNEQVAKYVLQALTAHIQAEEKWQKKVLESTPAKMKSIVRTLLLQFKWAKNVTVRSLVI